MLLQTLATNRLIFAPLMGLFFGSGVSDRSRLRLSGCGVAGDRGVEALFSVARAAVSR